MNVLIKIGLLHEAFNSYTEAVTYMNAALKLDPENHKIRDKVIRLQEMNKKIPTPVNTLREPEGSLINEHEGLNESQRLIKAHMNLEIVSPHVHPITISKTEERYLLAEQEQSPVRKVSAKDEQQFKDIVFKSSQVGLRISS